MSREVVAGGGVSGFGAAGGGDLPASRRGRARSTPRGPAELDEAEARVGRHVDVVDARRLVERQLRRRHRRVEEPFSASIESPCGRLPTWRRARRVIAACCWSTAVCIACCCIICICCIPAAYVDAAADAPPPGASEPEPRRRASSCRRRRPHAAPRRRSPPSSSSSPVSIAITPRERERGRRAGLCPCLCLCRTRLSRPSHRTPAVVVAPPVALALAVALASLLHGAWVLLRWAAQIPARRACRCCLPCGDAVRGTTRGARDIAGRASPVDPLRCKGTACASLVVSLTLLPKKKRPQLQQRQLPPTPTPTRDASRSAKSRQR